MPLTWQPNGNRPFTESMAWRSARCHNNRTVLKKARSDLEKQPRNVHLNSNDVKKSLDNDQKRFDNVRKSLGNIDLRPDNIHLSLGNIDLRPDKHPPSPTDGHLPFSIGQFAMCNVQ
jgi:hypothetical protein